MAVERQAQDPDERRSQAPKLSVVGRISGTVNGRPFHCTAREEYILVHTDSILSLRALMLTRRTLRPALRRMSSRQHIRLRLGFLPPIHVGIGA